MFEKILAPLDGTPAAEAGLAWAQHAASRCGASLELFMVVGHHANGHFDAAEEYLRVQRERMAPIGVPVTTQVSVGVLAEQVLARAATAGLTVMTYRTGPWTFGGALDVLLKQMVAPIVVVRSQPGQAPAPSCEKIIVPIGDRPHLRGALPMAVEMARTLGASLVLCKIVCPIPGAYNKRNPPPEYAEAIDQQVLDAETVLAQLETEIKGQGIATETIISVGEPAREIISAARYVKAGLIAMEATGSDSMSRILGSTALGVVQASPIPCLLIPVPAAA